MDDGVAEVLVGLINKGSVWRWKVQSKPVSDVRALFPFGFPKVRLLVGLTGSETTSLHNFHFRNFEHMMEAIAERIMRD